MERVENMSKRLDIDDNVDIFFNKFKIKKQEITLKQKELLEDVFLDNDYSLKYIKDMWYACILKKTYLYRGQWKEKELYRGEGDSQLHALLALLVVVYNSLPEEEIDCIRTFIFDETTEN